MPAPSDDSRSIALDRDLLTLLNFHPEDSADYRVLVDAVANDAALTTRLAALTTTLRTRIGLVDDRSDPLASVDLEGHCGEMPTREALPLLALTQIAGDVVAEYRRRGVDESAAWRSLADLGQQLRVGRLVHGRLSLPAPDWVAMGFTGGMLWVGRLQYTLEPCPWQPKKHVLSVHIPETGPLTATDVDSSFSAAVPLARQTYPEADIIALTCTSWLLDPGWRAPLGAESNLVRFAQRFALFGEPQDGRRDALFFTFHAETGHGEQVDLSALPRTSRLHRAVLDRLECGDPLLTVPGRILLH